jgi:mutator protein MutT
VIEVVTAILKNDEGYVLLQQRPSHKEYGGLFETPGGKVNARETRVQALARELHEELGLVSTDLFICPNPAMVVTYFWPHVKNTYRLNYYVVKMQRIQTPVAKEGQNWAGFYTIDQIHSMTSRCPSLTAILPLLHNL